MLGPVSRSDDVPKGTHPDAPAGWPPRELIVSWLGDEDVDFEFRPGEETEIPLGDAARVAEARRFRDVLGRFATGVTVVTSISDGEPVGMTCQSFSSVSLDPPLVLFCPAKTSRAWPRIHRSGHFCVNLLAHDQYALSDRMASRGRDKFAGLAWHLSPATGSPLFDGILGYVDCTIEAVHEAGDHDIVVGRVLELESTDVPHPLLFFQGQYARPEER
jgi:3-hydroxy-9,10-secoandrosta-1,3,5(10)-triene-9,17-dione monooxygenase reductase component